MRKVLVTMSILFFMLVLIGTAYADWIRTAVATSPLLPEYAALIGLGATMVALGAYGRRTLASKDRPHQD